MIEHGRRAGNYLRVRGEYSRPIAGLLQGVELPPRARRILYKMVVGVLSEGTTSACAENTLNELGLL